MDRAEDAMEEAIRKASVLIEALPYLRAYRERRILIKLGGAAMVEPDMLDSFLQDLVFLQVAGSAPIIVHGGGPAISKAMAQRGLEPKFVKGRRVTDGDTLEIVKEVLLRTNEELVRGIQEHGGEAEGLHVDNHGPLLGERLRLEDADGELIDLGLVGQVTRVRNVLIEGVCNAGVIPVLAPLAREEGSDRVLNVNADTVAGRVAASVVPEKLVFMSDTHGVRTDPDDSQSFASTLTEEQIQHLVAAAVIGRGMLPKVQACIEALDAGVPKAHIIDGRIPHSLLLEIFTDQGIGTQILH